MHNFTADARIETTHDHYGHASGHFDTDTSDPLDLTVQIPEGHTCANCTEQVNETVEGWVHDDTDSSYCDESYDPANSVNMGDRDELAAWLAECGYMDDAVTVEEALAHWHADNDQAVPNPSAPGNWAGLTIDPANNSTQVQISVGDPRGCLSMTVYRATNPDTGEEELHLSVPHPEDRFSHVTLTHLGGGTYRIG